MVTENTIRFSAKINPSGSSMKQKINWLSVVEDLWASFSSKLFNKFYFCISAIQSALYHEDMKSSEIPLPIVKPLTDITFCQVLREPDIINFLIHLVVLNRIWCPLPEAESRFPLGLLGDQKFATYFNMKIEIVHWTQTFSFSSSTAKVPQ